MTYIPDAIFPEFETVNNESEPEIVSFMDSNDPIQIEKPKRKLSWKPIISSVLVFIRKAALYLKRNRGITRFRILSLLAYPIWAFIARFVAAMVVNVGLSGLPYFSTWEPRLKLITVLTVILSVVIWYDASTVLYKKMFGLKPSFSVKKELSEKKPAKTETSKRKDPEAVIDSIWVEG